MIKLFTAATVASLLVLAGCQSSSSNAAEKRAAAETVGTVNPYLWRATLDTFRDMPVQSADPIGGLVVYDWKSFESAPNERVKATVYILDTRLRADGIKVSVFRQTNQSGTWVDAETDQETAIQLENRILDRARSLKSSRLS